MCVCDSGNEECCTIARIDNCRYITTAPVVIEYNFSKTMAFTLLIYACSLSPLSRGSLIGSFDLITTMCLRSYNNTLFSSIGVLASKGGEKNWAGFTLAGAPSAPSARDWRAGGGGDFAIEIARDAIENRTRWSAGAVSDESTHYSKPNFGDATTGSNITPSSLSITSRFRQPERALDSTPQAV